MVDRIAERLAAVDARVVRNSPICREHTILELALATFPDSAPGQFLQLRCAHPVVPPTRVVAQPKDGFPSLVGSECRANEAFLRRPFSIADRWTGDDGSVHMSIVSRAVGMGTRRLEDLKPGDTVNLTGPLGHGFTIPEQPTSLVLVGGGVGIPPLLYLARRLHELGRRDVTAIFGATTRELLPLRLVDEPPCDGTTRACITLPGKADFPAIIASDDGTVGMRGLVTDGLMAWHDRRGEHGSPTLVLACGPNPMLRAVAELTRRLRLNCQLSIERMMACGLGTCLSCAVRVRDTTRPQGWRWAQACTDGPVFSRDELLDYDT